MERIKPISKSIKAKRHTPQYRIHRYFARRPYNVFNGLISHYSNEGEIILDCFCGGGVTVFEGASLGRKVVGVDINPLATFITRMQMFNGDITLLDKVLEQFNEQISNKYEKWYSIDFGDDSGICEWVEWAYVIHCPVCGQDIILIEKNKIRNGIYRCPNESCKGYDGVRRIDGIPNGSHPIRVRYKPYNSNEVKTRQIDCVTQISNYSDLLEGVKDLKYRPNFRIPLDWDRQHEDRLKERGVKEYKHFFTDRNYAINCFIFNDIISMKDQLHKDIYEALYFLFSSSLRYTNNMTRVTANWENGRPTSMDKHAFWLPNQYVETNVIDVIRRRTKSLLAGVKYSKSTLPEDCKEVFSFKELQNGGDYLVLNKSSSNLPIPDKSIDVIITDPPYGSNVQYAELSTVWNAWYEVFEGLDNYIFKDEEAVVNRKLKVEGAKTEEDYEELLYKVFLECNRVLKDDRYMVFTFNNKNIKVWIAMMRAVTKAGFYLADEGVIFQDFIQSYKNTAHLRYAGNIHGDFIYTFVKGQKQKSYEFAGQTLQRMIELSIDTKIEKLFRKQKQYTTPELYQKIFSELASVLMEYIAEHIDDMKKVPEVYIGSDEYIDNLLKSKLNYCDGEWTKKGL